MEEFLKTLAISVEYNAAVYDRSILKWDGGFNFVLRANGKKLTIPCESLEEAQNIMEMFESEVFEGPEVPWSVFCPIRRI